MADVTGFNGVTDLVITSNRNEVSFAPSNVSYVL